MVIGWRIESENSMEYHHVIELYVCQKIISVRCINHPIPE